MTISLNKIIEAVQAQALHYQPVIEKNPSLIKNNTYEVLLLRAALKVALDNEAPKILDEIDYLVLVAWREMKGEKVNEDRS